MEEQRQRQEEGTRDDDKTPAAGGETDAQKPVAQPTGMCYISNEWGVCDLLHKCSSILCKFDQLSYI